MAGRHAVGPLVIAAWFIVLLCPSCTTEDHVILPLANTASRNQPVIVNAADTLTYILDAVGFSFDQTIAVSFSTDSLLATLVVMSYQGGSGQLIVSAADGSVFYSSELNSNRTIVTKTFPRVRPEYFSMSLSGYTGQVTFVLTSKR
jgi:hypothetical protein